MIFSIKIQTEKKKSDELESYSFFFFFLFIFWLAVLILASTINQLNLSWSIDFPSQRPLYRMAGGFLLETVPVSLWSRWQVNWL